VSSDPKRLTVVGATDLERTLLRAARHEQPSPELTARMAAGLGISVGLAATSTAAATAAQVAETAPAAMAAPATIGKTAIGAWVTAGVLAAAIGAGVVGGRLYGGRNGDKGVARTAPAVVAAPVEETPAAPAAPAPAPFWATGDSRKRVERVHRRAVAPAAPAADLVDQIALIDAARSAVGAGSTERALVLLRRYDGSYPRGAFRPEALALRIEALDHAGRSAEAQALARDFLVRYPQSPLADRVARVAEAKSR